MATDIAPETPNRPADPADPREGEARVRTRRWVFAGVVGLSILAALAVALLSPLTTAASNASEWAWMLPPVTAAMLVAALGWLAIYVMTPPAHRRDEQD